MRHLQTFKLLTLGTLTALSLSACNAVDRLSAIGEQPRQSEIQNPTTVAGYKPVTMPMPAAEIVEHQANSLWGGGSRKTFFKDQRAKDIGDILTVDIDITDEADLKNETKNNRDAAATANLDHALGFEGYLKKVLPKAVDPTDLLDGASSTSHDGKGEIKRNEDVKLKMAAVINQILPLSLIHI